LLKLQPGKREMDALPNHRFPRMWNSTSHATDRQPVSGAGQKAIFRAASGVPPLLRACQDASGFHATGIYSRF